MSRRPLIAAATAAALLLPVTPALAKPMSAKTVAAHAAKAAKAGRRASFEARTGNPAASAAAIKLARREAVTAGRGAAALVPDATASCASADQAIAALTVAAQLFGTATQQFATLAGSTGGELQGLAAGAVPGSIAGQAKLLDLLTQLTGQLQGDCQAYAAQAIALLQAAAPTQLAGLATASQLPGLPVDVDAILTGALGQASGALTAGLSELGGVLPTLPPEAQAGIAEALGTAHAQLTALEPIVAGLPVAGPIAGQVLDCVDGLLSTLGGTLGGTGATGTSGATGASAGLPGLGGLSGLSGLSGLLSGLGGGSAGGLFGGLLG